MAFNSYALMTDAGVALIDPLPAAPALLPKLVALGEFRGVFLTNGNHARAADWFRREYQIQVYAHENAGRDGDIKIDVPVLDGEKLPGGLHVIQLPGHGVGEVAWLSSAGAGILFLGDALLNPANGGVAYLPDQYCEDPPEAKRSLKKLSQVSFGAVTFAHGEPIVTEAKQQLTAFLKPETR